MTSRVTRTVKTPQSRWGHYFHQEKQQRASWRQRHLNWAEKGE